MDLPTFSYLNPVLSSTGFEGINDLIDQVYLPSGAQQGLSKQILYVY